MNFTNCNNNIYNTNTKSNPNAFSTPNPNTTYSKDNNSNNKIRDIKTNQFTDWKKVMSDKLVKRIMRYREDRIDSIRDRKEEILNDLKDDLNMDFNNVNDYPDCNMNMINSDEDMILNICFDRVLSLFENNVISTGEYEMEMYNNENVSFCPICSYPVIYTNVKVLCLNLCFEYNIPQGIINGGFTLENFVDSFSQVYKDHKNCSSQIELLIFEDEVNFICVKCLNN